MTCASEIIHARCSGPAVREALLWTSHLPVSEDDKGTLCLRPVGAACDRVCFLGSTGRGGAKACRRNRLFGPSTSAYFTDGRIDDTACGTLEGEVGLSISGSCNSASAVILTGPTAYADHVAKCSLQSCRDSEGSSRTRAKCAPTSGGLESIQHPTDV